MKKNRVLVLCYHRVNILDTDINLLAVSPKNFEQHMKYLKKNYIITRFDEDWSNLDGDGVVITFDDGYQDVYENAVPILNGLNIPVTIFVSNLTRQRELWWDELEYILLVGKQFPEKFEFKNEKWGCTWDTETYEKRVNCYHAVHYLMKNFLTTKEKNDCFDQLWKWKGESPRVREEYLTMNPKICKELSSMKGITLGGHTISHPCLAKLNKEEQSYEIGSSIHELEKIINKKVENFAYPFGQPVVDYNSLSAEICRENGIKKAGATSMGLWNGTCDSYNIPRNGIRNLDLYEYKDKIEKFWI